jgi:asparagine synthase (glutamine-hydrolysing)
MSAIFGLCYFDHRPVEPESLAAMQAVMSSWGPDGCHSWRQHNAGLGHALLVVSPASRAELMPLHDPERKQVLVAAARLDNRDELFDSFSIPYPERRTTPDGRLVQMAFEKWGENSPKKLYGDWSFAVWDYRRQRLFLARDQLGNTGLYYYHKPPLFAFASGPKPLLALPEVPRRLSEWHLACYLTVFYKAFGSGTFWKGIHQLLPGSRAMVTLKDFKLDTYWRLEDAPPVRLNSDQAYLEGFLDNYRRAVHCRLDSTRPVGVTLSSGLDSGSVTALAAPILRSREEKLIAFTSVPLYQADLLVPKKSAANEWPLAHSLATHLGNVEHIPVQAESPTPMVALERSVDIFGEPPAAPSNNYWFLAMFEAVRRRGLGVLLTGELGNGSVSWTGGRDRILFQLARGHFQACRRALTAWKQRQGCSWLSALKHHFSRPLLVPWWSQQERLASVFSPTWAEYAFIHPNFARRLGLQQVMQTHVHDASGRKPQKPLEERLATLWYTGVGAGPFYHAAGSVFGFEGRHPAADVRLVEYCLGLPDEAYTHAGGEKMLLRRGLAGLMPREILWNTFTGRQAADLKLRLLADRSQVETWLGRLENLYSAKEYLDLGILRRTWQTLQKNHSNCATYLAPVWFIRGLAAGIFIEKLEM